MKVGNLLAAFALGLLLAASAAARAETAATADANKAAEQTKASAASGFGYRPPLRGAPAARIGGGTRGIGAGIETGTASALTPTSATLSATVNPNTDTGAVTVTDLPEPPAGMEISKVDVVIRLRRT